LLLLVMERITKDW